MASRTATKKKKAPIAVIETRMVSVDELDTFEKNPRVGDVNAIMQSIRTFGQFRPIVVNAKNNRIIAGNHTFLAIRKMGEEQILASFVNVDDKTARAMVLADNKLADRGQYDDRLLAELLASIDTELIDATGYSAEEVDTLSRLISTNTDQVASDLENRAEEERGGFASEDPTQDDVDDGVPDEEKQKPVDPYQTADAVLKGAYDLKDDLDLDDKDLQGYWQLPKIRRDMCVKRDDLPDNLKAWAGSATRDYENDDQWWLYNYGVDSTSGIRDISKVIMSFYCYDEYFESWWFNPAKFTTKCINSGIKMIVMPDYSLWPFLPRAEWMWSLYRSRWLGRYFQEAGLKLIPNIEWPGVDIEFLEKHVLTPDLKGLELIAMQLQTAGKIEDSEKDALHDCIRKVDDVLNPGAILMYGGEATYNDVMTLGLNAEIIHIETRLKYLGERQKERAKDGKKKTF